MKKLVFIIILLQSLFVLGQEGTIYNYNDIEILNTNTYNKGLYFTYEGFIKNNPSKKDVFFKENTEFDWAADLLSKFWEDLFVYDSLGNKTRVKGLIWGYCDGESVFIYYKGRYSKFMIFGRYCVFNWRMERDFSYMEEDFILDILSGDIYTLKTKTLKKYVLKDYPELLERFKNESLRETMYYMYIKEVNSKFN